jgi:hypothetical protein
MPVWRGNTYRFTVTAANATANATYINNGFTFTVTDTIAAGTVLFCTGTGAPTASGTLTRTSGTGDATITFSANTAPNTNWGTSTNWLTDGSGAGVPTVSTDAVFDNISSNCTVNVAGVCRNLNFNSGTGYTATIDMANTITVGTAAAGGQAITLSPGMGITGTGALRTIAAGTTTLRSNGRIWPNALFANAQTVSGITSIVALADDWTVGALVLGASTQNLTVTGAFTISVNGNLVFNSSNRLTGVAGALSTIRMIGTGSMSVTTTSPSIGINLTIDAGINTVTINSGIIFGGTTGGTSGFTFSYLSGTVTCIGVFVCAITNNGQDYNLNLSGSNSTTATTTSSSGVNFDILRIVSSTSTSPSEITVIGTLCAVNGLEFVSSGGAKQQVPIIGGTICVNGNLTLNAYSFPTVTAPTYIFRGTGTWSENLVLSSGTQMGLFGNVIINTTGVITLGAVVGVSTGTFTYTAGSIVFAGFGFKLFGATLVGFGSGGVVIENLYHTTSTGLTTGGSRVTLTDTAPVQITNLIFVDFLTTRVYVYGGNIGFIVNNFNFQQTGGTTTSLFLANSITYLVLNSFIFNARAINATQQMRTITGSTPNAIFTLAFGASQDVYGFGAANIDSSAGQTIWSRRGTLSNAINWDNWTYPRTRFSSFTS